MTYQSSYLRLCQISDFLVFSGISDVFPTKREKSARNMIFCFGTGNFCTEAKQEMQNTMEGCNNKLILNVQHICGIFAAYLKQIRGSHMPTYQFSFEAM